LTCQESTFSKGGASFYRSVVSEQDALIHFQSPSRLIWLDDKAFPIQLLPTVNNFLIMRVGNEEGAAGGVGVIAVC
jgi:hypothetical protein